MSAKEYFGIDTEEERQIASLKIEIDEDSSRAAGGREVGSDERGSAAALTGKDRNHTTLFLRSLYLGRHKIPLRDPELFLTLQH